MGSGRRRDDVSGAAGFRIVIRSQGGIQHRQIRGFLRRSPICRQKCANLLTKQSIIRTLIDRESCLQEECTTLLTSFACRLSVLPVSRLLHYACRGGMVRSAKLQLIYPGMSTLNGGYAE